MPDFRAIKINLNFILTAYGVNERAGTPENLRFKANLFRNLSPHKNVNFWPACCISETIFWLFISYFGKGGAPPPNATPWAWVASCEGINDQPVKPQTSAPTWGIPNMLNSTIPMMDERRSGQREVLSPKKTYSHNQNELVKLLNPANDWRMRRNWGRLTDSQFESVFRALDALQIEWPPNERIILFQLIEWNLFCSVT